MPTTSRQGTTLATRITSAYLRTGLFHTVDVRGRRLMPIPITQPCGTRAAAARHRRRNQPLCAPCLDAERAYYRDRARIAYSIPAFRARENARTAERLRRLRAADPEYRARVNAQRAERRRRELDMSARIVDPVVVDRLCRGEATPATRAERAAAAERLAGEGCTRSVIAQRLHMSGARVAQLLNRRMAVAS